MLAICGGLQDVPQRQATVHAGTTEREIIKSNLVERGP